MAGVKKDRPTQIKDGRTVMLRRLIRDIKAYEHLKFEDPHEETSQKKRTNILALIKTQIAIVRSLRELELVERDRQARGEDEAASPVDEKYNTAEVTFLEEARQLLKKNKISNGL